MRIAHLIAVGIFLFSLEHASAHAAETKVVATYGQGWLERVNGLPILVLKGTEREMGEQYGYLAGDMVKGNIEGLKGIAEANAPKIMKWIPKPIFAGLRRTIGWIFWLTYPKDVKEHIKGIVAGAKKRPDKLKLNKMDISFVNTVIDLVGIVRGVIDKDDSKSTVGGLTASDIIRFLGAPDIHTNCDTMAVWGPRTVGGKTFQTRNTDIDTGDGLERFPLVVVSKKDGKLPVMAASFAGMVGIFSGMNANGVAVGQVWAFSKDVKLHTPWHLQIRESFMNGRNAREATLLFSRMDNVTYGSNFVFADKGDGAEGYFSEGYSIEASSKNFVVFEANDPRELESKVDGESYGLPIPYGVVRGDVTMDPVLRSRSTGARGPTGDPRLSGSYRNRYKGQVDRILAYEKQGILIGKEQAEAISRETAMIGGNLQDIVYANTDREAWVAYSEILPDGSVRQAYENEYKHIPFSRYLSTVLVDSETKQPRLSSWMPELRRELTLTISRVERKEKRGWFRSPRTVPASQETISLIADAEDKSLSDVAELHEGDVLELRETATGKLVDRSVI